MAMYQLIDSWRSRMTPELRSAIVASVTNLFKALRVSDECAEVGGRQSEYLAGIGGLDAESRDRVRRRLVTSAAVTANVALPASIQHARTAANKTSVFV